MTNASTRRTVIFAGGGTGGHLFPGIAVARELLAREPDARVLFVGSQKPIEPDIVVGAGFEHVALPSVSPSLTPTRIGSSLLRNWQAYQQARTILLRKRPSVVVGLGGFASVPPVLAAWRAGVPIVLLEQNVVPGKATRWLSRFADTVCLPWAETAKHLSPRIRAVVTGNPIRHEIAELANAIHGSHQHDAPASDSSENPSLARRATSESPTLLILGGSQGAASLNASVLDALATLRAEIAGWRIVHQTGAADLDAIRQRYAALSLAADVQPFFRDMAEQYRRATCVISRAGATTLAELACAGLPALLVPLPTSAHDHQRLNARLFADHSAALVAEPSSPAADSLRASLVQLLSDHPLRDRLRNNVGDLAQPQAARAVVEILREQSIKNDVRQEPRART
ncbi:MAG: undecaprenyldiphospho-muramoylpentapeptide beta-N-acetylglucosaminyltransferase [Planctomycetaceae bacterium]|nr:undecaprenyldiphospho-muramoylpentapeptide beta-N-acetylglucosaminyltransferase [Planctomycetaceae bacterium]